MRSKPRESHDCNDRIISARYSVEISNALFIRCSHSTGNNRRANAAAAGERILASFLNSLSKPASPFFPIFLISRKLTFFRPMTEKFFQLLLDCPEGWELDGIRSNFIYSCNFIFHFTEKRKLKILTISKRKYTTAIF